MSRYKCPPKVTLPTTSNINWCKTWLALKDDFSRYRLSHLYLLINKANKKSNQVPYLVSIHLIFPLTLIYWCGKSKHFFLNLSTFFQFSKRDRESLSLPPICTPIYHTIKAKKKKKNTSGTVPVTYREKHSEKVCLKSLNSFFSTWHKKPFTDIFQGFWPNMQLEHLLNNYFQEQLFWQNTFSDCFWK